MARPHRYQPQRALPAYAYVPGRTPRPASAGVATARAATDGAEYLWGADLYNHGYFWEAHEAWEARWRAAARASCERRFLQGLIQCAAACLKSAAGDAAACLRLSTRGLARLEGVQPERDGRYMGLELAPFIADFRDFAAAHPLEVERRPRLVLAL